MKKRLLYYELAKHLEHKNALVITGMRQVGKTTLMRQLFDELGDEPNNSDRNKNNKSKNPGKPKLWFDFDNPLDQKLFEDQEYKNIYQRLAEQAGVESAGIHKASKSSGKAARLYVFIDEIQNFPDITKVIKYLIDHYGVKFVLTGSSSFYLKNLFPESLSGRKFLYVLAPLSFKEFLYFNGLLSLEEARRDDLEALLAATDLFVHKRHEVAYEQYMRYGGFPEVVVTADRATKQLVLRNIFASFFEKDLQLLTDYADIRQLRDLILLLVPRVGSTLEITKLATELGVDRPKIYSFLEFLQGIFAIRLLPKFSRSLDRSVAGGRKVYFTDTGLLSAIGQVNDGQLFENTVCNQLACYGKLSFYNKRNTAEIDFILDRSSAFISDSSLQSGPDQAQVLTDKMVAFEAKLTGSARDVQKLRRLADGLRIGQCYVLSKTYIEADGVVSATNL